MFFDDHPEFLDTSSTANSKARLNLRHLGVIEENRSVLSGARVLDIASHDGRWSFAALEAGAAHVTGIEGRESLVANANRTFSDKGIDSSRFTFIRGDAHDTLTDGVGSFDVVMCLGFLYHTLRYPELFAGIRATGARYIIIDTAVYVGRVPFLRWVPILRKMSVVGNVPLVRLISNKNAKESAAVEDRFSYGGHSVVGYPTVSAVGELLNSYGYDLVGQTDWKEIIRRHPEDRARVRQYEDGTRVTLLAASRE